MKYEYKKRVDVSVKLRLNVLESLDKDFLIIELGIIEETIKPQLGIIEETINLKIHTNL